MLMDTIRIQAPDCYRCPYGKNCKTCNAECFEKAEKSFEKYAFKLPLLIEKHLKSLLKQHSYNHFFAGLNFRHRIVSRCYITGFNLFFIRMPTFSHHPKPTGFGWLCSSAVAATELILLSKFSG